MTQSEDNAQIQGELRAPTFSATGGSISNPIPGAVTQHIGSGEHAQNSIVYQTILWSFIGGGLLSAAAVVIAFCDDGQNPMSNIKDVWSIFAPLITLALGYVFGKGR